MRPFVKAGLFEDVSDVWDANNFHEDLAAIKPTMTIGGRQWGYPTHTTSGVFITEKTYLMS